MASKNPAPTGVTTVLYVGGESRSGSTVLSVILGGYGGVVAIGEFRALWKALERNELCGCGQPVKACEFWMAVGEHAYGGWEAVDIDSMLRADRMLARHRAIPRHMVRDSRSGSRDLETYRATLGHLYEAVRRVSGSRIIVDSTKDPSYAYVLGHVP